MIIVDDVLNDPLPPEAWGAQHDEHVWAWFRYYLACRAVEDVLNYSATR